MKGYRIFNLAFLLATHQAVLATNLNVTVVGSANGQSRFECWELAAPFISSAQSGIVGTQTTNLGDVTNVTYNVIPAGFDSGVHNAPSFQWAVVLQGLAVLTVPSDPSAEVVLTPGETALLFFADTADVGGEGHGCYYPGITETIFLQIPAVGNMEPEHTVVHEDAPCSANEYATLRGWATNA